MAGYIGSKGSGIISGIGASIADLNLTDKASANGTTEANKVLTADGNKDVTAIRNLTATGDATVGGAVAVTGNVTAGGAVTATGTVTRALTRGSIDVGNSSGVSSALAKGAADTVLTSDGTDISWAAVASGGEAVVWPSNWASPTNTYTSSGTWSKGSLADDDYVWVYIVGGGGGGDSSGGNVSGGQGGSAYLLYGKAGTFNGGTYVIGAGRSGGGGTSRVVSSFTLTTANGGTVFTTGNSDSNTDRNWARIANVSVVDTGSSPASNLIATPNDSSDIVLPSSKPTVPSPKSTGTTEWVIAAGMSSGGSLPKNCVFGGGGGGGVYSNWDKTGGGSAYAGNGATGSGGTAAQVPGGGGGGGSSGTAGANGNMRVYHV